MPPRVAVEEGGKRVNGGMDQTSHSEGPRAQRQAPPLRIAPFYPTALHHGTPILGLHRRTGLGGEEHFPRVRGHEGVLWRFLFRTVPFVRFPNWSI